MDSLKKAAIIVAERESRETKIWVELGLFAGPRRIDTGLGFFDHMLDSLACHAGWTLAIECKGDLTVDDHHSVEDCAIVLGAAFKEAAAEKGPVRRFGYAYAPMDDALARAVVDVSGRAFCAAGLSFGRETIGGLAAENIAHFFSSFAANAGITLHLDLLKGANDHHRAEAVFKAFALALRQALEPAEAAKNGAEDISGSTKGAAPLKLTKKAAKGSAR